jgi:hypothetical protein
MVSKPNDFNLLLLDSIDEALLSLGESARQAIYFHIEKNFQIALEKIFGVGARYIEILIMRNLCGRVGRSLELGKNEQLEFIKYVAAAKQGFNEKCPGGHDC